MISVRDSGFSGRGVLMERRKTGREEKKNGKGNGKGEWVFISILRVILRVQKCRRIGIIFQSTAF